MNKDKREALKIFLMIGAPIMLVIGAAIPSFLILPIVFTLFFGTFMGAYIIGDIEQEQEKWKSKVILLCSIVIVAVWVGVVIELQNG